MKITIKGWNDGFEKVAFTKLQMEILNLSLRESKNNTDNLLEHNILSFDVNNGVTAELFVKQAIQIGANCIIE